MPVTRSQKENKNRQAMEPAKKDLITSRLRTGSSGSRITAKAESAEDNRNKNKNSVSQCPTGSRPSTSKIITTSTTTSKNEKINTKQCTSNNKISGIQKLVSGTTERQVNPNNNVPNNGQQQFKCNLCDKIYMSASGLGRHRRGGCVPRTVCDFCGASFNSLAGVRLHEKSAHPVENNKNLEDKLKVTADVKILQQIAQIEATCKNGYFYKDMIKQTGLTHEQIKYRRNMPIYKEYLKQAEQEFENKNINKNKIGSSSIDDSAGPSTSKVNNYKPTTNITTRMPTRGRPAGVAAPPDRINNIIDLNTSSDTSDTDNDNEHQNNNLNKQSSLLVCVGASSSAYQTNHNKETPIEIELKADPPASRQLNKRTKRISTSLPSLNKSTNIDPFYEFLMECREQLVEDTKIIKLIDIATDRPEAEIISEIESYLSEKFSRKNNNKNNKTRKVMQRPYGQMRGGRGQRASNYKKCQDLYNKNRSALADIIINGRDLNANNDSPDINDVERLYAGIYETDNTNITQVSDNRKNNNELNKTIYIDNNKNEIFLPVTAEEVRETKIKWGNSAPGPDGVLHAAVKSFEDLKLAVLFTIILQRKLLIPSWQIARTTLIYKTGERKDPGNWRPITVSSMLQRLFHRILYKRIKSVVNLNKNQRGFTNGDGTLANTLILQHYIRNKRASRKPYNVISLDIKKAFDTVSHAAVRGALVRQHINKNIIDYIINNLKSTTTEISVGGQKTRKINIKRGVKQGDPLSPLLFNLVIDELLYELDNNNGGGTLITNTKCKCLAFADDLVLLEDSSVNVPRVLGIVNQFMNKKGMEINPKKCSALSVEFKEGKPITRTKSLFQINNTWIAQIDNINSFKYLGHEITITGLNKPTTFNLNIWLQNIAKAAIKPDQKIEIIRDFVIPKLHYGLQTPTITSNILRDADRLIRKYVKKFLHFNIHTSDAVIHGKIKDGGMGIMDLRGNIPRILLNRITKLIDDCDLDIPLSAVLQHQDTTDLMYKLNKLTGDVPSEHIWKERITTQPTTKGLELSAEDPSSRNWILKRPKGWTGKDYVKATQLRTANLPTAAIPSNPPELRMCRGGCGTQETLNHVLQKCPVTHYERIYRHNEIAKKIAKHCRDKGWQIEEEPHVRHQDGQLYKPDIVIHKNDRIVVTDVQVSWEGNKPFENIWKDKELVYNNKKFLEASSGRWPGKQLLFLPLIVGARGIWPRCNERTEKELKMTIGLKSSCVHSALKWGPSIHNIFTRAVWKRAYGRERNAVK